MKKAIISLAVGFIVAALPILSIHLAITLHEYFSIVNFPTAFSIFAFLGLIWGPILTDIIFYIIAGIVIGQIAPPKKIILALLVALVTPFVFQYFSVPGFNLTNYTISIVDYIPSILVGLWLGGLFKKSPTTTAS